MRTEFEIPRLSRRPGRAWLSLGLCALMVACGGGGGGTETPQSAQPPAPAPAPAPTPAPAPAPVPVVRSLDTGGATLGVARSTQQGVAVTDVTVTLHTEDGVLYATRWPEGGAAPQGQALAGAVDNATLAAHGDRLLAVYLQAAPQRQLVARESTDGGQTWDAPQVIAVPGAGPAWPSACLFRQAGVQKRLVTFSATPAPGDGPLVVVRHDGAGWGVPVVHAGLRSEAAALSCADDQMPEVVWRDHRDGAGAPALWQAGIDLDTGALRGERHLMQPGLDPSTCRIGDRRFVGWHGADSVARLAFSDDAWQNLMEVDADAAGPVEPIGLHGREVAVACAGDTVAVAWSDWPSGPEADALAPTRRLAVLVSRDRGARWTRLQPAGRDPDQGPATVAVHADGRVAVAWRSPGALRLATWPAP